MKIFKRKFRKPRCNLESLQKWKQKHALKLNFVYSVKINFKGLQIMTVGMAFIYFNLLFLLNKTQEIVIIV